MATYWHSTACSSPASSVRLHPGCASTLHDAIASGIPTHVCSVGWSSTLIAATLAQHISGGQPPVHANEVEVDGSGSGTGRILRCVY